MEKRQISWSIRLLRSKYRIAKVWSNIMGAPKTRDMNGMIKVYRELWKNAAVNLSAEFSEIETGFWKVKYGSKQTIIMNYKVQIDDLVVLNIAGHKPICYILLERVNIPVPQYMVFGLHELDKAKDFIEKYRGNYFVVKPGIGTSGGMGVTTHIKSFQEIRQAAVLASLYCDQLLIERWVVGETYRILVLGGRVIHASRRRGLRIIGDGKSSIRDHVMNLQRQKSQAREHCWKIKNDRDCEATLDAQSLTCGSVPKKGDEVLIKTFENPLKKNVEPRTFFNENVTGLICQDLREKAVRAAETLGSRFAGVDIITLDPTVSLEKSGGVINEVNTTPGLHHHYHLDYGPKESPAETVLAYLLKESPPKH